MLLGKACLAKFAPNGTKYVIILRQRFHLMPETAAPQRLQASFLRNDPVFDTSNVLLPKAEFLGDGPDKIGRF